MKLGGIMKIKDIIYNVISDTNIIDILEGYIFFAAVLTFSFIILYILFIYLYIAMQLGSLLFN